jgi:hypothetical protein
VEFLEVGSAQFLVDGDVVVGLAEGLPVQLLEVLLELLEGALLEDGVAVEVDDGEEGALDHLERPPAGQLLPHEHQVAETQDAHEHAQQRLAPRQLDYHLHVRHLLRRVLLPLPQQQCPLAPDQHLLVVLLQEVDFGQQTHQRHSAAAALEEHAREDVLEQVAEDHEGSLLAGEAEEEGGDSAHALAVADLFEAGGDGVEDVGDVEARLVLVLHAQLHRVEELLHRVVEHAKVRPPPNHVLLDYLRLLVELASRTEVQSQEVSVLVVLKMLLPAA